MNAVHVDVDNRERCPLAAKCETCGSTANLGINTIETPVGVACATMCQACAYNDPPRIPPINHSWSMAIARVNAHCAHLGCTVDQMDRSMRAKDGAR